MHKRRFTRAAGVSPPWVLGKCICRNAAAKSPQTAVGVLTNAGAVAVVNPRGAYAPRSCIGVRTSAGEITIFAMHERTSARAAGVSPPWCGHTIARNGTAFVDEITFRPDCEARNVVQQERRASARRGADYPRYARKRTHDQERWVSACRVYLCE
jgi:hypothetical protein